MDRKIIYPGQIPMVEDQLQAARFTQIGVGRLAGALYDESGTGASGFTCAPGSGLSVTISPGQIIQPGVVDASTFGVLPASASALPRQYVLSDPVDIAIPSAGASYIIYATASTSDTVNAVLPYYNSANPSQTFAGAANNGQNQPTVRADSVTIGVAASVPSGSIPLWSIVIPGGATAITTAMISVASGAPLYPSLRSLAMRSVAPFNANLAAAFKGYPSKAIVADPTTTGVFWVSTADNNLTTPGASGASWTSLFAGLTPTPVATSGSGAVGIGMIYTTAADGRVWVNTYTAAGANVSKILAVADTTTTGATGKVGYTIPGATPTPVDTANASQLAVSLFYRTSADGMLWANTFSASGAAVTCNIVVASGTLTGTTGAIGYYAPGLISTPTDTSGTGALAVNFLYTTGADGRVWVNTYSSTGAKLSKIMVIADTTTSSSSGQIGYVVPGLISTPLATSGANPLKISLLYFGGSDNKLWANSYNSAGTAISKVIVTPDSYTLVDNGTTGYRISPDGWTKQWTTVSLPASGQSTSNVVFTYPIKFPTRCTTVKVTTMGAANSSKGYWPVAALFGAPGNTACNVIGDTLSNSSNVITFDQTVPVRVEVEGY